MEISNKGKEVFMLMVYGRISYH